MTMAPIGYDGTVPRAEEGERLRAGMEVYGVDAERVGTVADIGRNFFLVQDGLFSIRNMYLPRSVVAYIEADAAYLRVPRHAAEAMARADLPAEGDTWYGVTPVTVRTMEIPLREQVLVTRTIATVTSEVHLRKDVRRDASHIAVPVQREAVRVEETRPGMKPSPLRP